MFVGVLKCFLYDDGEKRDIINDLADPLDIMFCLNLGLDCLSSISLNDEFIIVDINSRELDSKLLNFIMAYQVATIILKRGMVNEMKLYELVYDSDEFKLALKIYNRIYKDDEKIVQDVKTLKLKKNEMEVKNA